LEGIQEKTVPRLWAAPALKAARLHWREHDPNVFNVVQDRKPLDSQFSEMVQGAKSLGLRALKAPARLGWFAPATKTARFRARRAMIEH